MHESAPRPQQTIETTPSIESTERTQLRQLEATGEYVFHGSPYDGDFLSPQQAVDTVLGDDDAPAIHASQVADYAIFMAVAAQLGHARNGATESDDTIIMNYGLDRAAHAKLTDTTSGWVYVFRKSDFKQRRPVEWISYQQLYPVHKIRVTKQDLPPNIELFDSKNTQ